MPLKLIPGRKETPPLQDRRGPMEATLKCPSGAAIILNIDEPSQGLTLTIDAEGSKKTVLLPQKSAHSLRALLMTMTESALPWRLQK